MMVRLKPFDAGAVVRLQGVVSYPLPHGIMEGQLATVIDRQSGSVKVRTPVEGEENDVDFWIPLPNVNPGQEMQLNGRWLDENDRRVKKALARRAPGSI